MEIIDAPLVRVPFESLKRAAKERKSVVDEAGEAIAALEEGRGAPEQLQQLDALLVQLQGLKRKLAEASRTEAEEAHRCRVRLEHLNLLGAPSKHGGSAIAWNQQRLGRLLVDHMLRCGHHSTAACMMAASPGMEHLVDVHIFTGARRVVEALARHDCSEALRWCSEHRARLKRIKSPLEFRLRLQEFIELVRKDQQLDAVRYARQYLAPWAAQYMAELQRAIATLAFTARTKCPPYRALFEESAWGELAQLFRHELYRLHCLPPESLLTIHLHAGLSALKTPASSTDSASKEDPLHLPAFQALARDLPCAKHVHSKLICAVTREIMNDSNPPMVLPNGYVYSQHAVDAIANANGGRVVCPKTGSVFAREDLRRAFIA